MNTSPKQAWWSVWLGRCGRGVNLTVVLLIMLHLAVTLPLAFILNIWVDEAYSLHTTSGSLKEAFVRAIMFEQQAPAYFLLLDLWRRINPSPIFARILSALCTAVTLVVAARISRHLFPGWSPAWLVAFLAFNPVIIWAAVEVRVYPMAILAATLVLLAFYSTVTDDEARRRNSFLLVFAAGLGLYTQYYLGFLLAALGVGLVVACRSRDFVWYAKATAGVVVLCLPIAFWLPSQLDALSGASTDGFTLREAAGFWLYLIASALVPGYELLARFVPSESYRAAAWGIRLGFAVATVTLLVSSKGLRRLLRSAPLITAWVALLVGAACFAALGLVADASLVSAHRHWSFLSVLGAAAFLSIAWATGRPKLVAVFVGLALVLNVVVLVDSYSPLAKEGDAKRVAEFLAANEQLGEPILVFPNELALPLRIYYSGVNTIVPVPREVSLDVYDPRNAAIQSEEELLRLLDEIDADATSLWLVLRETSGYRGVSYNPRILEEVVASRYSTTVEGRFFEQVTVRRLTVRANR